MKTSDEGVAIIEAFEGLRLSSYFDVVGVCTIGYGSTYINVSTGQRVYPGMVITKAQADQMLRDELSSVESYISAVVKVPLNQPMFDALVSFTFNVGTGGLAKSSVLRLLNIGDYTNAANALLLWNKAGGMVRAALTARRQAERNLFIRGIAQLNSDASSAVQPTVDSNVPVVDVAPVVQDDTPVDQVVDDLKNVVDNVIDNIITDATLTDNTSPTNSTNNQ